MGQKADRPSRVPVRRWTTQELAHLVIPNSRTNPEDYTEFVIRYHEGTGYDYTKRMPLDHALRLITGAARTPLAWKRAKQYLAWGIPSYPQKDNEEAMRKAVYDDEAQLVTLRLIDEAANSFLNKYGPELTAWQFIDLAETLARAKESMRAAASKRNLGKHLGQPQKKDS
jgi:hypothetical protein